MKLLFLSIDPQFPSFSTRHIPYLNPNNPTLSYSRGITISFLGFINPHLPFFLTSASSYSKKNPQKSYSKGITVSVDSAVTEIIPHLPSFSSGMQSETDVTRVCTKGVILDFDFDLKNGSPLKCMFLQTLF